MKSAHTQIEQQTAWPPRWAVRRGLAPLELVLALPLLLCVMALMINFAHASIWKVRSATAARISMWRHRPLWNADGDPKPSNFWPQTAVTGVVGDSRVSQVDAIWNHAAIAQGWIKGPVFTANGGYLALRDNRVNEMSEGVSQGRASVDIKYPFLPSMGILSMRADHSLLDSLWQYHTMGYGWNEARRAKGWWMLEDNPAWAGMKQVYLQADARIVNNPQRELLRPLDRDPDLMARHYRSDFYPYGPYACSFDVEEWRRRIEEPNGLLDQIRNTNPQLVPGVALTMAYTYLQMYRDELDQGTSGRGAQLALWIEQLKDFIRRLGGQVPPD